MGYTYRGAQPAPTRATSTAGDLIFNPAKCGTYAGYKQHQNHGVPTCADCRKANSNHVNEFHKRKAMAA